MNLILIRINDNFLIIIFSVKLDLLIRRRLKSPFLHILSVSSPYRRAIFWNHQNTEKITSYRRSVIKISYLFQYQNKTTVEFHDS